MATRARIGLLNSDGTTETVYCHYDGYPERMLPLLKAYYNGIRKVKSLLKLGDLSYIDGGYACAYHRDMNRPYRPSVTHTNIEALCVGDCGEEWFYLYNVVKRKWEKHKYKPKEY